MDFLSPDVMQNILLGIIGNGLTSLIAHTGQEAKAFLQDEASLKEMQEKSHSLQGLLQDAADAVAEKIEWNGPADLEQVCSFLMSPEVESIMRQIYAAKLLESKDSLELVRQEFLTAFSLYTGLSEDKLVEATSLLLATLIDGCDYTLSVAIDHGILAAHEAKSSLRYRILADELATIRENLSFLTARHKPDIQAILEFEKQYRQQVDAREGFVKPPYVDAARKFPIDEIYVSPNFAKSQIKTDEVQTTLNFDEFVSVIYRAVLLGNPGGGKSTFTQKLCHDLITHYPQRLLAGRRVTPIRVILREYGAEKKIRNCSILQFIEITANADYQVEPPRGVFEYLLLNGRAIVIFDGLDELLDTSHRQEISDDVEAFCTRYPSVPVVVTSREVGYEQAPLNERRFDVFRLAPFSDKQVREYVTKWFTTDSTLSTNQQKKKVDDFVKESEIVSDLRSNPLILALMCNIYLGENYIPENRPEVYRKCAEMLFERWDKSRGIQVQLSIQSQIRPAMMDLAYWIYADDSLQSGVTEQKLIARATEYLYSKRFEDRDEAESAAREFIEFCRGRAWVFTDTGTTERGERLYQFTHRTFLEYFTAAFLDRNHPIPVKLQGILLPRIAKREWDVVAQLAFQLQYNRVEGAGDELLLALITESDNIEDIDAWNLLSFASRCLEFIVPNPRVTRDITKACVQKSIKWAAQNSSNRNLVDHQSQYKDNEPSVLVGNLLNATKENQAPIDTSIEQAIIELVNNDDKWIAFLSLELGLHLTLAHNYNSKRSSNDEPRSMWTIISDRIFEACIEQIKLFCPRNLWICHDMFWHGHITVSELVELHGIESLFLQRTYTMFPLTRSGPPALGLIDSAILVSYLQDQPKYVMQRLPLLDEAGKILISAPTPWIKQAESSLILQAAGIFDNSRHPNRKVSDTLTLSSDAFFGAFVLIATLFEAAEVKVSSRVHIKEIKDEVRQGTNPLFNYIRLTLFARSEIIETGDIQVEMDSCAFSEEQQIFAWRWIRREINLVQQVPVPNKKRRKDKNTEKRHKDSR